jgi:thiol-disulfide isomerase/thioredoxin
MKSQRSAARMSIFGVMALALGWQSAFAAPPGEQLIQQVTKAYQDIQQYDATLRIAISQSQGRWTTTQQGECYVTLDRPGSRLLVDMPDQIIVADGRKLFFRTSQIPGKHLEVDAVSPLSCEWIAQHVQGMTFPQLPIDFAFLLSNDPLAILSQGAAGTPITLPPDSDDADKRPRIQAALQAGTLTLTIDPKTYLIDKAVVEVDTKALGAPAGAVMSYTFDIEIHSVGEPLEADRFAFDTASSKASPSLQHMMASGSNAPNPLVDQATPPLNLPDIDGNDHDIAIDDPDAKVIVLDFWATWCPPCVAALPELQEVYDWAKDNGKEVAFYAVNQGETVEEVKRFWADNNLTIPVLMDENFTAGSDFQVTGIPQTVIISDGKVKSVHVGYRAGFGEQMKAEIEGLLNDAQ